MKVHLKYFFRSILRNVGIVIPADAFELRITKMQYRITDSELANTIRPRVSQQAVNLTLQGKRKSLLPKIELALQKIIAEKK